eukprot:TRINITY_DN37534_c0_g1_i1.p1 TRINITY_DN37534_c0_g1~~TRINITY_DN37534_c0_g1_i1.p1  ORF type:complete len:596 (+),score=102.56 TRINITY_DN37534_c0_g1_i1:60-1847(+)
MAFSSPRLRGAPKEQKKEPKLLNATETVETGLSAELLQKELQALRSDLQTFIQLEQRKLEDSICGELKEMKDDKQTKFEATQSKLEESQAKLDAMQTKLEELIHSELDELKNQRSIPQATALATPWHTNIRDDSAGRASVVASKGRASVVASIVGSPRGSDPGDTHGIKSIMNGQGEEGEEEKSLLDGSQVHRSNAPWYESRSCKPLYTWVMSQQFEFVVLFIIVVNTVAIGFQTEYKARHWTTRMPVVAHNLNIFCDLCFAVELGLRYLAYSSTRTFWSYFCNNIIDCFVIAILIFEQVTAGLVCYVTNGQQVYHSHHELGIIRITRALRLVKIIRSPVFIRMTAQLRAFVISFLDTSQAITWAIVFIVTLTYLFAVFLTVIVTDFKVKHLHRTDDPTELLSSYGTVGRTMLSLYIAMLDGEHWYETAKPLFECSPWLVFAFVVYMTICILGVMNMVSSIFVTAAMKNVDKDALAVIRISFLDIMHHADTDKSGSIDEEELEEHLQNPQVLSHLMDMDFDEDDCRNIFHLCLESNESRVNDVGIDHLVSAATRLHGPAKAIDLAMMRSKLEKIHDLFTDHLHQFGHINDEQYLL